MGHVLSYEELIMMRRAGRIARRIIKHLGKIIKPGITTKDIEIFFDRILEKFPGMSSAFKGYKGYPASLCVSVNEEVIHGIPSEEKVIKSRDLVSVDIGIKYKGLFVDTAYTYFVGKPSTLGKKIVKVCKTALREGIKKIRVGARVGDVSSAIQKVVENNGFSVIRSFFGHGIGRALHCEPAVPNFGQENTGEVLKEGMVLAVEPMISSGRFEVEILRDGWTAKTMDNSLSCHFEHTVAVTKRGPWILTK